MTNKISKSEKLDIFLALAAFFEFKLAGQSESKENYIDSTFKLLSSFGEEEIEKLKRRAKRYETLTAEKRKAWQKFWLEKLRNQGQTRLLDPNIHTERIIHILKDEPKVIQQLIFKNLPENLAEKVAAEFKDIESIQVDGESLQVPNDEIAKLVRNKFLSNFIAFEDLYQPSLLDEFSYDQLSLLVRKLGIIETAISCRGIETKENLAIFLKPFESDVTKQIAHKIAELENIKPSRVLTAEKNVRAVFRSEDDSERWIENLGIRLIAMSLTTRDDNAKQFTIQKFPVEVGDRLAGYIDELEKDVDQQFDEVSREIDTIANEIMEADK